MVFDAFLRFRKGRDLDQDHGQGQCEPAQAAQKARQTVKAQLLKITDLPPWCDPNPYILTGYRPPSNSWYDSLASWKYPHNETGNIYSHLIPGVLLLFSQGWLYEYARTRHSAHLTGFDWMVVSVQVCSGVCCLFVSALYHTGLNHSEGVARRWLGFDYGGILGLILGNFVSGLHFGFYCTPALKYLYWGVVSPCKWSTSIGACC